MTPWLIPPKGPAAALVADLNARLPRIETDRLVLRPCQTMDWEVLEPIWTSDRGAYIGGPMNGEDAWLDFNQCISSWLLRGTGALTITTREDDTPLGIVVLCLEHGDPEMELGWLLIEEAEGHGYATEAAAGLRDWAYDALEMTTFVSFIHKDNVASVKVAERLGAMRQTTGHPMFDDCIVYRHTRPTTGAIQ